MNIRKNRTEKEKSLKVRKKHPVIKRIFKGVLLTGLLVCLGTGVYVYKNLQDVPKITTTILKTDSSANMYASDGKTLIWSSAKYKRKYVDIKDVPDTYKNLLLGIEDTNFYNEHGFSAKGLVNAGISLVKSKLGKGEARGGSSIEQQLIKLSVFSTNASDRTVSRKIKEIYLATQMDKNYSKDQILEFYINKIWLGENSYGAQTISYTYFGKPLKELTVSQQAIIAGLGQAPASYNLYTDPKLVERRRNIVLARGLEVGAITQSEYDKAKATPVKDGLKPRFWQSDEVGKVTGKHNAFVTSALEQIKSLGYDLEKTPLQITTTLDINAENHIKDLFDNGGWKYFQNGQQAATTITDPKTGDVLVQIGGIKANTIGGLNRATSTNRSSGSAIKPILDYGPALENFNWASNHAINSNRYNYVGTNVWAYDYGGSQHGMAPIQTALRQSYNTAAIRALDEVGATRAKQFINDLGINTNQPLAGSSAISLDVSTAQMASAIGAFGQDGVFHPTRYVKELKFADDSVKKIEFKPIQAMRPSTAFVMTSMLKGVFSSKGTAPNAKVDGVAMAGKTGTNGYPDGTYSGAMDLWTIGYSKSTSIALWYGFDTPMKPGNQLAEFAGDANKDKLFKDIMAYMSRGKDVSDWKKPDTVKHLGGSGLDAHYQATDSPAKIADRKNLNKVPMSAQNEFQADKSTKNIKPKKPKAPEVPKNYKKGEWQDDLKAKKEEWNDAHKDDMENAKKVGDDE